MESNAFARSTNSRRSTPTNICRPKDSHQLSAEMDKFLKFCYYDSYRNQFGLDFETTAPAHPAQKKVVLSSVLIRYVDENVRFKSDEFQKEVTYKTYVLLLTPKMTLFDVYVESLIFWDLVPNLNPITSYNNNLITETKKSSDGESRVDTSFKSTKSRTQFLDVDEEFLEPSEQVELTEDMRRTVMHFENIYKEKKGGEWPSEFTRKFFESNTYTVTDSQFNDLSSLFRVAVNTFFGAEDYSHNILYLKKKNTRKTYLFTSQTLSYQNELLQKDNPNDNDDDDDALLQSKGESTDAKSPTCSRRKDPSTWSRWK